MNARECNARYQPLGRRATLLRAYARRGALVAILVFLWIAFVQQKALLVVLASMAFVALLVWFFAARARQARASAALADAYKRTTKLLAEGRLEEAAAETDATLDLARAAPPIHCILLVQRAQLHLRDGDADRAHVLLQAVRASRWLDDARLAQGASSMASALAMTQLARGELDDAEMWQREAHARIKKDDEIQLLPLDALVDARRGRFDEAAARIDDAWSAAEASLAPRAVELLRFVRAFAADASGGVADLRAAGDADAAYLAAHWPELRAFVEKRAHAQPPPPPP
jgi:hypothetical protein